MKISVFSMAAAAAATALAVPALAQSGHGNHQMKTKSQGAANASDRARERANPNSAVAQVQPGMMVHDRNNRMVGRVRDVRRSPNGAVTAVVVALNAQVNNNTTLQLAPGSFAIVNNVVVINQVVAG